MPENHHSEREKFVIDLYKNQNKSIREIAKIAKMSFRDIGYILRKEGLSHGITTIEDNDNDNKKSSNEKATQAYRLFSEGKKPIQIAIQLDLREKQVNKLYREFWKLKRVDKLYIYPQIEHYLPSFLKLHGALKKNGLNSGNVEWFVYAIEMGAVRLPELQGQYQSIQNKVWRIEHRKQELERDCHAIQRETVELTQTHNTLQQNFDTLTEKVNDLYNEKCQLEQFVSRFKNGNRAYLEIKSIAEQIVYGLLAEHRALLTSAIIAAVHALRENPDRCAIIFDNSKYDDSSNNEYLEALRQVASSFLKVLSSQMLDNTMVAAVKEK